VIVEFDATTSLTFSFAEGVQRRRLGEEVVLLDQRNATFVRTPPWHEAAASDSVIRTLPLMAGIKLTRHCDLACRYCYSDITSLPAPVLSLEEFSLLARSLRAVGVMAVTLTGGEPSTCGNLVGFLRIAGAQGFVTFLETNGVKILKYDLNEIRETGCHIRISLDSVDPKTCVSLRVGKPAHICHAIEECIAAGINVVVRSVITAGSLDGLPGVLHALGKRGVKTWILRRADPVADKVSPFATPADRRREEELVGQLLATAAFAYAFMSIKYRTKTASGVNIVATIGSLPALRAAALTGERHLIWGAMKPNVFSLKEHQAKYFAEGEDDSARSVPSRSVAQ
jgi:hypothetical protein